MSPGVASQSRGPLRQLIGSVSGLLATAIGIGRTRLELLSVELREELYRIAGLLVWGTIAVLAAGGGIMFAGLAVIFAFWDTHRVLATVLVTLSYFVLAGVAAKIIRDRLRTRPPFLQATLSELARDEDQLRGRWP